MNNKDGAALKYIAKEGCVESYSLEVFQKTKQTSVKNDVSIFDSPLEHGEGVNYG